MTPTFPLSLSDASLVLAVAAIFLVTSEILSSHYGTANVKINKKRLRNAALTTSILFLATVAIRIGTIIYGV